MNSKELNKCINYTSTIMDYKKKELIRAFNRLNEYEGQFTYKNVIDKLIEVME